jgi:hypothetical protein
MDLQQTLPRRAHADDLDAFDDHQLLLVAIEQLAVDLTVEGQAQTAARLRELARRNA